LLLFRLFSTSFFVLGSAAVPLHRRCFAFLRRPRLSPNDGMRREPGDLIRRIDLKRTLAFFCLPFKTPSLFPFPFCLLSGPTTSLLCLQASWRGLMVISNGITDTRPSTSRVGWLDGTKRRWTGRRNAPCGCWEKWKWRRDVTAVPESSPHTKKRICTANGRSQPEQSLATRSMCAFPFPAWQARQAGKDDRTQTPLRLSIRQLR
jgi:hypothetical protein